MAGLAQCDWGNGERSKPGTKTPRSAAVIDGFDRRHNEAGLAKGWVPQTKSLSPRFAPLSK